MRLTQDDPQECLLAVDAAHRPPPWTLCLPRILTNRPSAQVSLWPWAAQGPRVAGGTLSVGDRRRALDHLPSDLQQRVAVGGLVLEPTVKLPLRMSSRMVRKLPTIASRSISSVRVRPPNTAVGP